jgi:transcription elongation factor GreA
MPDVSYLTADGALKLRQELEYLKGPAREELSRRLRSAIQQGDLSENADYTAAKEDQGFLEGRIQELERVLNNLVIIEDKVKDTSVVDIGARITIQEGTFEPETYHMVGPKEADPANYRISHESPIGKALLGRHKGDTVLAETPGGSIQLKILKIE